MPDDRTRALPRAPVDPVHPADPEDAPTHAVARASSPRRTEPASSPGALLRAGTLVDRYLVLGHLGSGGLGDVYAAYDTELERKIAIKLVRPPEGPASAVLGDLHARALREAQALARLRHPNVVAVHDVGTHEAQIYLAMELVEGRTISMWLNECSRGWKEIRDVFVQAGQGLAAAHAAGLVHRDFKLGNVLVANDGRVVVLDFGLARALEVGAPSTALASPLAPPLDDAPSLLLSEELTDTRVVLGTPQYLAPELWSGGAATTRTDIFAFSVALHRCLYGVFPFAAATADEHRQAALAGRIDRGAAQVRVPTWLQRAVARGLHGNPDARFHSIEEVLDVLVTDRRRTRRAIAALLVALPVLSVGVAVTAVALRPEPTAQEIDAAQSVVLDARAAAARGHYVYPPPDAPHEPTAIAKVLELEGMRGAAPELASDLRTEMADALVALGDRYYERPGGPPFAVDFYAAALVFDPARERARERVTLTPGQLADLATKAESGGFTPAELVAAEPLAVLADTDPERRAAKARRFAEREQAAITTRERLDAVLDDGDVQRASVRDPERSPFTNVVEPAPRVDPAGSADAGAPSGKEAVAEPDKRPDTKADAARRDPEGARQSVAAGKSAMGRGDLSAASAAYSRALELDRSNPDALVGLAELSFERGDYQKARTFAKRATGVAPKSSQAWILLGDACFKVLDYDAARDAYERAAKVGASAAKGRLERLDKLVGG